MLEAIAIRLEAIAILLGYLVIPYRLGLTFLQPWSGGSTEHGRLLTPIACQEAQGRQWRQNGCRRLKNDSHREG